MTRTFSYLLAFAAALLVPLSSSGSSAQRLSFDKLISEADRVVVAELESKTSAWGPSGRLIFTTYTFAVQRDVLGEGEAKVTLVQPGGTVGRLTQRTHGYPSFLEAGPVLLFLRRHRIGHRVVGLSQGVFGFHDDRGRKLVVQRLEGLSFPGDHGRPLIFDLDHAISRIQQPTRARIEP